MKINKKINSLGILAILIFSLTLIPFNKVSAQYYYDKNGFLPVHGYYNDSNSYYNYNTNYNQYPYNTYQNTNPAPVYNIYQPATTTPTVTSTPATNTTSATSSNKTTVAKKATTGKIVASAKVTSPTNNGISTNNLVSNALFGSSNAYPSSLLQWLFLAILIIFIIILVRRVYGSREKYLASPLKHD